MAKPEPFYYLVNRRNVGVAYPIPDGTPDYRRGYSDGVAAVDADVKAYAQGYADGYLAAQADAESDVLPAGQSTGREGPVPVATRRQMKEGLH